MEVKVMDKNKVEFGTLKYGSVFLYGGRYYMKFYHCDNSKANVIDLNGDCTMLLHDDVLITPIAGYFMVEG